METIKRRETQPKKPAEIQLACHSHPGRMRTRNEDACSLPPPGVDRMRWGTLLAVADGVGGMAGGQAASQQAVAQIQALYYAAYDRPSGRDHPADRLRETVEGVNSLNRLAQRREGITQGHLTTLVALLIFQKDLWVANVGDSRAYLIQSRTRQRRQLTEDHSSHVRLAKAGLVREDSPDARRTITRAIGLADQCQVDIYHYTWEPGDALILCSDGLASLSEPEMVQILIQQPPALAAQKLVEQAVHLDGSDNCTAVVACWISG